MSQRARRHKPSAAARLRPFRLLLLLAIAAAAFGGYEGATWPGFFPTRIDVVGNSVVPSNEIVTRAALDAHENIWLQNTHAAARRIEASIPYVKTAAIHRRLPAGVTIEIAERTPFALLVAGTRRVVVDRDLRVLEEANANPRGLVEMHVTPSKPLAPGMFLTDSSVVALRDDITTMARGGLSVRSVADDRFGDLVAVLPSGIDVLFGDDSQLVKRLPLVMPILDHAEREGRGVTAIDLRAPTAPVVVFRR